jgi:hypothetical protein
MAVLIRKKGYTTASLQKISEGLINISDSYIMTDLLTTQHQWSKDDLEILTTAGCI